MRCVLDGEHRQHRHAPPRAGGGTTSTERERQVEGPGVALVVRVVGPERADRGEERVWPGDQPRAEREVQRGEGRERERGAGFGRSGHVEDAIAAAAPWEDPIRWPYQRDQSRAGAAAARSAAARARRRSAARSRPGCGRRSAPAGCGPGQRLPPSRALAADLGVARRVVVEAYEQLAAEGWLDARVGAGTFVRRALRPRYRRAGRAAPRPSDDRRRSRIDFFPGHPGPRRVPAPGLAAGRARGAAPRCPTARSATATRGGCGSSASSSPPTWAGSAASCAGRARSSSARARCRRSGCS